MSLARTHIFRILVSSGEERKPSIGLLASDAEDQPDQPSREGLSWNLTSIRFQ